MSKTSLCINMLEILGARNIVSISELADILDTNPRNIPEYRKELETAGYYINTTPGRYGGYSLVKKNLFPSISITREEAESFYNGYEYLLTQSNFMDKKQLSKAVARISTAISYSNSASEISVLDRYPLAMDEQELEKRYQKITECIANKESLNIEYESRTDGLSKRVIHPYKLFMFNNAWFVLAFDEKSQSIRYFKLNRIAFYIGTGNRFKVYYGYDENEYLDKYGMKKYGKWYEIKLKIGGESRVKVKDRIYGKEQTIKENEDQTIEFSCKMQNEDEILSFVLGIGRDCTVIEPLWLKEKLVKEAKAILEKYLK